MPDHHKEQTEKLLQLMREALQRDQELRDQFHIGEKFRFIRDRIVALVSRMEESLSDMQQKEDKKITILGEDEKLVYVHLFNAHGQLLQTWQKMVNPSVFYEHSVNRPVYNEKNDIESFIRTKPNKAQHGYLTIVIKKADIYDTSDESMKDLIGNQLIKVKEGSLKPNCLLAFTHNQQDYLITENGVLIKKTE